MEGRITPTGPVSPLRNRAATDSTSSLHCQPPKGSVSPLHSKSTPKRSVSPFYNRTPSASVSTSNNAPKRSSSPMHQTPRGSVSPLHSRTPKGSASPVHNQACKRSVSPYLGQRPKGSVSPLHSQAATGSSLHALIPKRSPSPLPFRSSSNSSSTLPSVTPKRSVSPFLGKSPKAPVPSQYTRNPPKGSVSPLHDKASNRSVSPLPSLSSKGSVSPLHTQAPKCSVSPFQHATPKRSVSPFQHGTPKRSVSPFQHGAPKRSVSPFQHQTPKGSVSPSQSQVSEYLVSPLQHGTPEFPNPPFQSAEKVPSDLIPPQNIEEVPESSGSHLHDEEKPHEGSVSPLRMKEKPTPNYLKASSGTCHDVCKYGGRHEFEEEKGKHVVPRNLKRGKNNGERRKKTIIKLRSLSSGKIVFSEKIEIIVEDGSGSNEEASNAVEWQDIKSYDDASVPSEEAQNEGESVNSNNSDANAASVERRNNKQVLKSKESNEKDVPEKKDAAFRKNKESNKIKPDGMKENTLLHERKTTASAKPKLYEVSEENTRKPVKSSKAISRMTAEKGDANDMQKPVAAKVESSPKKKASFFTLLRSSSGRRSLEGKSEKGVNRPKKGSNTASTSSNSETKEKVLHMIEPKTRKTGTRPGASRSTEEQDTVKPEKSTFRRGKVVELPPDPGTTRKLKFRKGRRSSENLAGFQIGKRSFRRKGSISGGSTNSHGQVVVLRHRETEEKKGIQGLFNSIIEETVNKLVKTRKSKVKALVGAFETVISLQDSKPVPVPVK